MDGVEGYSISEYILLYTTEQHVWTLHQKMLYSLQEVMN